MPGIWHGLQQCVSESSQKLTKCRFSGLISWGGLTGPWRDPFFLWELHPSNPYPSTPGRARVRTHTHNATFHIWVPLFPWSQSSQGDSFSWDFGLGTDRLLWHLAVGLAGDGVDLEVSSPCGLTELGHGTSKVEKTNPQKENRGCTRLIANKYETLALFLHSWAHLILTATLWDQSCRCSQPESRHSSLKWFSSLSRVTRFERVQSGFTPLVWLLAHSLPVGPGG